MGFWSLLWVEQVNPEDSLFEFSKYASNYFWWICVHVSPDSIHADGWYRYIIEDNICYLTCTEKDCQKRVCFGYLEDIKKCFLNYVQGEYHDKYVSLKR